MNDNVLVRVRTGNHKVGQKCIVIPGVVVQRNLKFHRYKVQFYMATSPSATQRWFIVSSITSVTFEDKKRAKPTPRDEPGRLNHNESAPLAFD